MCYTFEIKTLQNISENNDVLNFLDKHLNRSLFAYPNINEANVVRGCYITNKLEGLVIISNEKTAMYVLSDNLSIVEYYSILEDAQDYKHTHCYIYEPMDCTKFLYVLDEQFELAVCDRNQIPKIDSSLQVSELCEDDWVEYLNAINQASPEYKLTVDYLKRQSSANTIYIGKKDNNIISGLTINGVDSMMNTITSIFTIPEYQKNGYARQLISNIIHNTNRDFNKLSLYYNNPHAKKLYDSLNFKCVGKLYKGSVKEKSKN